MPTKSEAAALPVVFPKVTAPLPRALAAVELALTVPASMTTPAALVKEPLLPDRVRLEVVLFWMIPVTLEPRGAEIVTEFVPVLPLLVIVPMLLIDETERVMPPLKEPLLLSTRLPVPVMPPETVRSFDTVLFVKVVPALLTVSALRLKEEVALLSVIPVTFDPTAALIVVVAEPLPLLVIVPTLLRAPVLTLKVVPEAPDPFTKIRFPVPVTPPESTTLPLPAPVSIVRVPLLPLRVIAPDKVVVTPVVGLALSVKVPLEVPTLIGFGRLVMAFASVKVALLEPPVAPRVIVAVVEPTGFAGTAPLLRLNVPPKIESPLDKTIGFAAFPLRVKVLFTSFWVTLVTWAPRRPKPVLIFVLDVPVKMTAPVLLIEPAPPKVNAPVGDRVTFPVLVNTEPVKLMVPPLANMIFPVLATEALLKVTFPVLVKLILLTLLATGALKVTFPPLLNETAPVAPIEPVLTVSLPVLVKLTPVTLLPIPPEIVMPPVPAPEAVMVPLLLIAAVERVMPPPPPVTSARFMPDALLVMPPLIVSVRPVPPVTVRPPVSAIWMGALIVSLFPDPSVMAAPALPLVLFRIKTPDPVASSWNCFAVEAPMFNVPTVSDVLARSTIVLEPIAFVRFAVAPALLGTPPVQLVPVVQVKVPPPVGAQVLAAWAEWARPANRETVRTVRFPINLKRDFVFAPIIELREFWRSFEKRKEESIFI